MKSSRGANLHENMIIILRFCNTQNNIKGTKKKRITSVVKTFSYILKLVAYRVLIKIKTLLCFIYFRYWLKQKRKFEHLLFTLNTNARAFAFVHLFLTYSTLIPEGLCLKVNSTKLGVHFE